MPLNRVRLRDLKEQSTANIILQSHCRRSIAKLPMDLRDETKLLKENKRKTKHNTMTTGWEHVTESAYDFCVEKMHNMAFRWVQAD